ncbi:GerMN domain-containing protein [Candidatus Parcubacteria bacterium]|nr:GerMN domain-containing protein [Patescibacteria group bacterium]MBU4467008.1 GerMN domain-containing protein [Patescibacteria group bacterium]MCG2688407.1 GerMN domain-containing protein [Candidatus Parcubacteria bacterium]
MKNIILVIAIVLVVSGIILGIRFFSGSEDTWICQDGRWLKHGQPSAPMPVSGCGQIQAEDIKIYSPESGQTLSFPLVIEGQARGNWYFEASFPIKLLSDKELAVTVAQAQADWMTEDFVPFKAVIDISFLSEASEGILVFQKDNPSGLPENDKEIRVPVYFPGPKELTTVKVFFNNSNLDPEFSCNRVFPTERLVSKTQGIARIALESLFRGSTFKEQEQGFSTSINPGVKIQELTIENNIARVDFDSQLEFQVGGSCRVSAIRAQIEQTLKQFPTVNEVIISINGRTEDILQP